MTWKIISELKCRGFIVSTQRAVSRTAIWSIMLSILAAAAMAAAPAPRTVLFLGDSITAGYGVDVAQAYPALIQERINAKGWNFKVVNAGQSGDTSAGGLARLDWLMKNPIDVLVLELGGNDGLRGLPVAATEKNLQSIIDRARQHYPEMKLVIAGMKIPPNLGQDYAREFNAMFPRLAKKNKAALIPFILEGVGGVRKLNLSDGIHPTDEGHAIVARNVWQVLEPVLHSFT
jgi:acyl-CoA thioesterase I